MGAKPNSKLRITTLQRKALRNINNQPRDSHSSALFKKVIFKKVINLKIKF